MDGPSLSAFKCFPARFYRSAKVRCTLRCIDWNNKAGSKPSGRTPSLGVLRRFIP